MSEEIKKEEAAEEVTSETKEEATEEKAEASKKEKKAKNNFRKLMVMIIDYKLGVKLKPSRVKISKVAITEHTYKVCAKAAGQTIILSLGTKEEGKQ